ncbi:MAG: Fic family protein [Desulfopila sp.]
MPKQISQNDLERIVEVVGVFPHGAGIEAIYSALDGRVSRRTLQRRLALLVEKKRLIKEGQARASRYCLPVIYGRVNVQEEGPDTFVSSGEIYIPVSREGEECKRAVRRPVQGRQPVGYNRSFLDSYRPNSTFYLPGDTRQKLAEIGRLTEERQMAGTCARQIYHRLLIDLSWNSSRLEGNTYSLLETERLLEQGEAAEGKTAMETQMLLNHKDAIEFLVEQAAEVGFNRYTILNLHGLLSNNLLADPQACGRLRTVPVRIGGSVYHSLVLLC